MRNHLLVFTVLVLILSCTMSAQTPLTWSEEPAKQRFWTWDEVRRQTYAASGMFADALTTQRSLANGWEEKNPVARPFVNNGWPGQIAGSGLAFGGTVLTSYWLHRTGHHKMAKFVPLAMGTLSYAAAGWNAQNWQPHRK